MSKLDESSTSEPAPQSMSLFPYHYEAAVTRLGVLAGIVERTGRMRGLETLFLDVLHRERIATTHRATGDSLEVGFELFGEPYRLVCLWEMQRIGAVRLAELVAPFVTEPRTLPVVAVMNDLEPLAKLDGMIVVTRDLILNVLEGRDTWREMMELQRAKIGSGERPLYRDIETVRPPGVASK